MIENYLIPERIHLQEQVKDWQELVDVVGDIMCKLGDVDHNYTKAIKNGIEKYGPYSVVVPGVVILHARPEDGVKNLSVAFVTLEKGVNFGSENDPVFVGIGLAATDNEKHLGIIKDIAHIIENEELIERISSYKSDNVDGFITYINDQLNNTEE